MHERTIIDQPSSPPGRFRCQHDLLDGECAICLGVDIEDQEFAK